MAVEAYQTKQGKRYRASFLFQGQRPSERGFKTIEAAKSWISDERKRLRAEAKAQPQKKTHLDFLDISTKYLKDCAGRMKGANTTRQKTFVIEQFLAFLKSKHDIEIPDTVERSQVREYITDQVASRGEKAANRDLRDLKALFNWAIREELTRDNPAARIESVGDGPPYPALPYRRQALGNPGPDMGGREFRTPLAAPLDPQAPGGCQGTPAHAHERHPFR